MTDEEFMELAIEEAKKGDFPFGAVIVKDNEIIAKAHNTASLDPTGHAEINAIREACKKIGNVDLSSCVLYSTCEPCPMCFTACWWSRISKIVYGYEGEDVPESEWKIDIKSDYLNKKSGNKIKIKGGVLKEEIFKLYH